MSLCRKYNLIEENGEFVVLLYLNIDQSEFSTELLENIRESFSDIDDEIKKFVEEKFPSIKVTSAKLLVGALVVGTVAILPQVEAKAAVSNSSGASTQQLVSSNVAITKISTIGTVNATKLNVRNGASTSNTIIHQLFQGNRVNVIGVLNDWYQIKLSDGRIGWVSKVYLKLDVESTSRQQKIDKVIATAKSVLGTPYVWGGDDLSDGGFDCSGLVQYSFKSAGYSLNRISADQAKQGETVSKDKLKEGDLVFYSLAGNGSVSHVGIYLGNGKMIHSPKSGDVTKITDITTEYWKTRFVVAKRIF